MPSKLRKAIGAVKDQTSISLAKVSTNASSIDVLILKATSHDDVPIEERYVDEVLEIISSNRIYAAVCAKVIAKRISKTKNWIVALKCLVLVLRILQDGDPHFPREVLNAMKRGAKILNLSNFRDDSASTPWDYTTFVRTYALYLDDRLDCFLTGKLQKKFAFRENSKNKSVRTNEPVRDMKPATLLDRLSYWQKLLGRAIATRPTGPAKENSLVRTSLYAIIKESFDLYRDISDGLALLLDSFFHLKYQTGICCFQTCVQASKQFEELCEFYDVCKSIGVGRKSEYPSVQKISDELIETLQEFLKDQASFPSGNRSPGSMFPLSSPTSPKDEHSETISEQFESFSERDSGFGSRGTSFDDFASIANSGTTCSRGSSMRRTDQEGILDRKDKQVQEDSAAVFDHGSSSTIPDFFADWQQNHQEDILTSTQPGMTENSSVNLYEDWLEQERQEHKVESEDSGLSSQNTSQDLWELVLFEEAKQSQEVQSSSDNFLDGLCSQNSVPQYHNNPFLQDALAAPLSCAMAASEVDANSSSFTCFSTTEIFSVTSTFQTITPFPARATPTFQTEASFHAQASESFSKQTFEAMPTFSAGGAPTFQTISSDFGAVQGVNDPFATNCTLQKPGVNHEIILHEQKLWLENQNRIIAKHLSGVP